VLLVVAVAYRLIQLSSLVNGPQWGYDFSAYWAAARSLLDHGPLYRPEQLAGSYSPQGQFLYLYPPVLAALVTPLAALFPTDYRAAAGAWFVIGLGALLASVWLVVRVERLAQGALPFVLLVGAAIVFPPVVSELVIGNVHLLLLLMLSVAWWGIRRGDGAGTTIAGLAVGVAVLIKVFPVLVALWFLATGRVRAAAWAGVGMIVVGIGLLPLTGVSTWLEYPQVLLNLGPPSDVTDALAPSVWLGDLIGSLPARVLVLAVAVIVVVWAARRLSTPAGYGIAVSLAVLVAPAVFHHYLAILVLPMLLALAAGEPRRWVGVSYFAMWAGQQPALGPLAWLLNRAIPALGAVSVPVLLARFGRRAEEP
jgi:hypothetical protein